MRPLAIFANGLMLAATPANGGHYFIDLLAGIAVAVLAIAAARRIGRLIARPAAASAASVPAAVPAN
jgi:PAP2 superfamily